MRPHEVVQVLLRTLRHPLGAVLARRRYGFGELLRGGNSAGGRLSLGPGAYFRKAGRDNLSARPYTN